MLCSPMKHDDELVRRIPSTRTKIKTTRQGSHCRSLWCLKYLFLGTLFMIVPIRIAMIWQEILRLSSSPSFVPFISDLPSHSIIATSKAKVQTSETGPEQDTGSNYSWNGGIPHLLWFTYRHNILTTKKPRHYYNNILKTIRSYQSAWNHSEHTPTTGFRFLDDEACLTLFERIQQILNISLTEAFMTEQGGNMKADLCRLAALYLYGGYYFDVDLEVIQPIRLAPNVTLSTVKSEAYFFQAFLAATPYHPVILYNLQIMEHGYLYQNGSCWKNARLILGSCTMQEAILLWQQQRRNTNDHKKHGVMKILFEMKLKPSSQELNIKHAKSRHTTTKTNPFAHIPMRGQSEHCHWVVYDRKEKEVYFYSRVVGSKMCPK